MNKLFSKKIWTVTTIVVSTLLAVILSLTQIALANRTTINVTFGFKTHKTIQDENADENSTYYETDYASIDEVRKQGDLLCEEIEGEGLVLLKNDGALPLSKQSKVSTFATGSTELNSSFQGTRASADATKYPTLKEALESCDIEVNSTLWDFYRTGAGKSYGGTKKYNSETGQQVYYINEVPWSKYTSDVKESFTSFRDAAIVVFTRDGSEGSDLNAYGSDGRNGDYLSLSQEEYDLLTELTKLKNTSNSFQKIIVLLNSASALQLDFLNDEQIDVDACLWIGNVGSAGINAVAKALVGDINPSGRLTDTYVYDNFSSPAMAAQSYNNNKSFASVYSNYGAYSLDTTQRYYANYVEGIYVGYRYYETRYTDKVEGRAKTGGYDYASDVAYPYGYGLSYSEFSYVYCEVTETEKTYEIEVTVRNDSETAGKEVVQVYLQKEYTQYDIDHDIEKSAVELVGFAKTDEIEPGKTDTVSITVEKEQLRTYDTHGAGTYIYEDGDYYLTVGKNSHDAANNILAAKGYTMEDGMDAEGDKTLVHSWNNPTFDDKVFSQSSATGNTIENQLADIDMNTYAGNGGNSTKYVSRSDWEGTFPKAASDFTVTEHLAKDLQSNKEIEEDPASKMPRFGADNGLTLAMLRNSDDQTIEYDDSLWDSLLDQMTFDEMNELLTTAICNTAFIESITKPQSFDQDSPTACKESTSGLRFPCEGIWGSSFNTDLMYEVGVCLANDSLLSGYQGMYAPGINLHRTPYGGRTHEYFSEDSYLTGKAGEAVIKGMQSKGVITYPKHYILNDAEDRRGGVSIWCNEQSARELYIEPWKYAVEPSRANSHALMTSFNRVGAVWSSASENILNHIVREELGFEGYVITDMASSNGASYMTTTDGLPAGTDCWLSGSGHSFAQYKNNATVCQMMRESTHRILYNIANYSAAMNGYSSSTRAIKIPAWWEVMLQAICISLAVLTIGSTVMLAVSYRKSLKSCKNK